MTIYSVKLKFKNIRNLKNDKKSSASKLHVAVKG